MMKKNIQDLLLNVEFYKGKFDDVECFPYLLGIIGEDFSYSSRRNGNCFVQWSETKYTRCI